MSEFTRPSVEITLEKPLVSHQGQVRKLTLSEPTGNDYLRIGEPVQHARNTDGTVFVVENEEAIREYIIAGLPPELDDPLIGQLSLADAMKAKDAVLGFFQAARGRQSAK